MSYKFRTKVADHLFCKYCGVKSFYKPASHPNSVSINYHSIIKPPKIKEILFFDGKNWDQAIKNLKTELVVKNLFNKFKYYFKRK